MASKAKRQREHFEIGDYIRLADLAIAEEPPQEVPPKPTRPNGTKLKPKREPKVTKKRSRKRPRKNYSVGITSYIEAVLASEEFFDLVEEIKLPAGLRGPEREYSEITVMLWLTLLEDFDSIRDLEAYFGHPLIWKHVASTLESVWPDNPERRISKDRPMSRSQFCGHRAQLRKQRPDAMARARQVFTVNAVAQALNMGYFPTDRGSLSKPDPRSIVSGDGTVIAAATNAIKGDLVVNEDGVAQQARFDADAALNGKDQTKKPHPAYTFEHLQAANPDPEQERVILTFGRADDLGEAQTLKQLLKGLQPLVPHLRHYCYDMAPQGASINRLARLGLHPIIKVPRDKKNQPTSALIETRKVKGRSGREYTIQIWGLDGVVGIKAFAVNDEFFVKLTPKILREPRPGTQQGFYEFPDIALIHEDLRGREIMVRLDGLTDDGRNRPQYIRWFNEHTDIGTALLGMREGTEGEHSTIKRMLPWQRARSFSEFHVTSDLLGYFFGRNLKAALAHERRTGTNPMRNGPPPQVNIAAAA